MIDTFELLDVVEDVLLDTVVEGVLLDPVVEGVLLDPLVEGVLLDRVVEGVLLDPVVEGVLLDRVVEGVLLDRVVEGVLLDPVVGEENLLVLVIVIFVKPIVVAVEVVFRLVDTFCMFDDVILLIEVVLEVDDVKTQLGREGTFTIVHEIPKYDHVSLKLKFFS